MTALCCSCAALQRYAEQRAETACGSFAQCTVYDDTGRHEAACFQPPGDGPSVFAGDSAWPLSAGVCRPVGVKFATAG